MNPENPSPAADEGHTTGNSALRRVWPAPLVSLSVFVVWLLINNTIYVGHVLLAALLAWGVPHLTGAGESRSRMRAPFLFARLMLIVLWDIVVSNLQVARRILGPESAINPQFLWVPLDLETDLGKLWLAGIITMTPGTVSALFSEDRKALLVHTFDVDDAAGVVDGIKQRYEAPLKEIFG
jgi:multicomponent K+:H+ antiporter subunit E